MSNTQETRKSVIRENPQYYKNKTSTLDMAVCALCQSSISFDPRRFLQDVQYHYTLCLWREEKFQTILPPINNDENARQYRCGQQGCSGRIMKYKEYCFHEAIAHRRTQQLLANDSRPGVKEVAASLSLINKH